ncbi:MAG: FtsW/RodA/SpoVE family cell cycle protein [Rikenellaceae bacterium]|nr:FtsW/RodA/SpoVE family cell cycle protein [Rikenellaceae bacterium]
MENGTTAPEREQRRVLAWIFCGDRSLWVVVVALAVLSLLVIYSSTASLAYKTNGGNTTHYLFSQFCIVVMNLLVIAGLAHFNYQLYHGKRVTRLMFWAAIVLMAMTFFVGTNLNDAHRWLRVPVVGITFQPSDFLKVALVIVLARQLAKRQNVIDKIKILPSLSPWDWKDDPVTNRNILFEHTLPLLLPIGLSCALIFFSNFSTSALTFVTCWIMLYIGRVKVRELFKLLGLVAVAVALAVSLMATFNIGRSRTWVNRVKRFAAVEQTDASGAAAEPDEDDLQSREAKIAVASGGLFGKGPGLSTQRANLPHSYSDFAYAFVVEEYGLVGAVVVLLLYLWIFYRSIIIFKKCGTAFPSMLVLGLGLLITLQALINMCVSVTLLPVTGQTLPLVSKGGSSSLFMSMALGIMLGISRQIEEQSIDKPRTESLTE